MSRVILLFWAISRKPNAELDNFQYVPHLSNLPSRLGKTAYCHIYSAHNQFRLPGAGPCCSPVTASQPSSLNPWPSALGATTAWSRICTCGSAGEPSTNSSGNGSAEAWFGQRKGGVSIRWGSWRRPALMSMHHILSLCSCRGCLHSALHLNTSATVLIQ